MPNKPCALNSEVCLITWFYGILVRLDKRFLAVIMVQIWPQKTLQASSCFWETCPQTLLAAVCLCTHCHVLTIFKMLVMLTVNLCSLEQQNGAQKPFSKSIILVISHCNDPMFFSVTSYSVSTTVSPLSVITYSSTAEEKWQRQHVHSCCFQLIVGNIPFSVQQSQWREPSAMRKHFQQHHRQYHELDLYETKLCHNELKKNFQ